ncbi:MAG: hypothetical protein QXU31_06950 [Archaeoglobaceae archaeon]
MMRAWLIISLSMLMISTASALDFNISAEEFGSAMLKATISSIDISQQTLKVLILANNSSDVQTTGYMFQNLWGIIYGALVLAGWQNKISMLVLEEISNNSEHYNEFGAGINYLGSNATTVFGDTQGTKGLARIMLGYIMALNNSSRLYDSGDTLLQAYAKKITEGFYSNVVFLIELFKAIPSAFNLD